MSEQATTPSRPGGVSRRRLLKGGAATTAAFFIAHATGNFGPLEAAAKQGGLPPAPRGRIYAEHEDLNDDPIDPVAVEDGSAGWFPSRYGAGDEIGALNEITPEKTLAALQILKNNKNKPPKTYSLGELLEPGVPAFTGRFYEQQIQPPIPPPYFGENQLNGTEERIQTTYHIATQLDGLPHIGVRDVWYNGFTTEEVIGATPGAGVLRLGQHLVKPFVTRGILLDVLSLKVEQGDSDALGEPVDGKPILANSYRITVEDLEAAMERGGIKSIEPGDAVVMRTGWTHLFTPGVTDAVKRARYLASEPGIYLREARWLAHFRPAVVASDTWAMEVLPAPEPWSTTQFYPLHQEFLAHHGIRIGEAWRTEDLVADGVSEFVLFYTGPRAKGATAGFSAPGALAQPA